MEEFMNCYLPLIFGIIFAYSVFKAVFFSGKADDSSCSCNRRCNCNNKQNTNQPKYTTYTIIDSKTTSSTKL